MIDNIVADDADKSLDVAEIEEAIQDIIAKQGEKTVTIAKPEPRPAPPVMSDPAIIIGETDEGLEAKSEAESEAEKAPAIIIAEDPDAPALLSEPSPPPTALTPGFEIAANSPKIFKQVVFTPARTAGHRWHCHYPAC